MGGNCLKKTFTRRYQRDEYFELCDKVTARLWKFGYFYNTHIVDAYHSKDSFGDMDIIYTTFNDRPLYVEDVQLMFPESKEIVRNTHVISFEMCEFQIDMIHCPHNEYWYSKGYFSYNDVAGNLVGKIAHRFGLKHGHDGLSLEVRDDNHVYGRVYLTQDFDTALEFLGLDVDRYQQGFDTLEEAFEWVSASKFFSPDDYELENLSHAGRIRDKKRTTYQKFLAWTKTRQFDVINVEKGWINNQDFIYSNFPSIRDEVERLAANVAVDRYVKNKFNGKIVSELTGLTGKELGLFMKHLRSLTKFSDSSLVLLTDDQIRDNIRSTVSKD